MPLITWSKNMKNLVFLSVVAMSLNISAAEIVCGSTKVSHKRTYPINKAAIELAAKLNVKTCTGTSSVKFKAAMKQRKDTGKFVVVTDEELQAAKDKLSKAGGLGGPSFNL